MTVVIDNDRLDRIASSKHAQIALEDGAKAGFKAYMKSPGRDRSFDLLNAKRGFDRYCGEFGPYLEVLGLSAASTSVVAERTDDAIQAMIESSVTAAVSKALAAAGVIEAKPARTTRKARTTKAAAKLVEVAKGVGRESRFTPKVVASLDLPTKAGATFKWAGKRSTSTWKVLSGSKAKGIVAIRVA